MLAVATLTPLPALASHARARVSLDSRLLVQLNEIRVEHGLEPLVISPALTASADKHSLDMITKGYFAHTSSNGTPMWERIAPHYVSRRYSDWLVGENLFWSPGQPNAAVALSAWMASPDHRANILNPNWRQIGIAAVSSPVAPDAYGGRSVTVITTDFGVRGTSPAAVGTAF
jgi:uncharacterized protein YkwD